MASFLNGYRRYRVDDRNVAPGCVGIGFLCLSRQVAELCDACHIQAVCTVATCAFRSSNPA